jgi:hypothetical protein
MCLLIGVTFLMMCLLGADIMSGFSENALMRALRESLIIGGWVSMWRPLQIFLYEWWPIVRRGKIFRHLAKASVHVTAAKNLSFLNVDK